MPAGKGPTRAEFERLKSQHASAVREIESLRESMREARHELKIQFKRIAEMQAILDDERREMPTQPNPLSRRLPT